MAILQTLQELVRSLTLQPARDYLIGMGGILLTLIIARIYQKIYQKFISKFTKRAKDKFGRVVKAWKIFLQSFETPLFWAIILAGVYFSLSPLIPARFLSLYNKSISILVILWGLLSSMKIVDKLVDWKISKEGLTKSRRTILLSLENLVYVFLVVIAGLLLLAALNIEITPLLASLGIGGLAVALALQPTIANYFSGIYVTMDRSVRVGDYLELENGMKGYVENIGWRSTRIKSLPNNIVIIPNSKLTDMIVTNYHAPVEEMSVVLDCGVSYDSDLEKVEQVTIEVGKKVLKEVKGGVGEFEPFIRYKEFGDSNIQFSIILRVNEFVDKYLITHEFIKALKKRFDEEGIEISFSAHNVYMRESKGERPNY